MTEGTEGTDRSSADDVWDGLLARSKGMITQQIRASHVVVAGCGSVGSYAIEQLVRSGVGEVTLIDPDVVEFTNLSRAGFYADDVGSAKVNALGRRLAGINPSLVVNVIPAQLQDLDSAQLTSVLASASVFFCALDDRRAQLQINQWSYWFDVPAVYVGIFAGAKAGEACVVRPPGACFSCATAFRQLLPTEVQGDSDYGTGRLTAEIALGVDIHAVTSVGVRLALSCLMDGTNSSLESYARRAVDEHAYALVAVSDEFDVVDELLRDAPGQYSHRSVWLTPTKAEECNICGPNPDEPRLDVTPSIGAILRAARTDDVPTESDG